MESKLLIYRRREEPHELINYNILSMEQGDKEDIPRLRETIIKNKECFDKMMGSYYLTTIVSGLFRNYYKYHLLVTKSTPVGILVLNSDETEIIHLWIYDKVQKKE